MGFFSSIGKVFKKVAAPVAGVLGGVLGGPAGAVAGATMADAVWNGGSSGSSNSDWYKSTYGDQMAFAREQFDFNKQYIQNQLQWRVEDAKKAGLHPMAVLGINGASFSPVSTPSIPSLGDSTFDPVGLGQSVAYAATKAKTNKQQEQAFNLAQATGTEQLRGVQLDNELKMLEIMSLASRLTQTGPAAPDLNPDTPIHEPEANTGLRSPKSSAYHVWDMGEGNFDILMNPDYQQTIGDEFGQVATTLKAITRARSGVWTNPEDGIAYVFDPDSGYFRRLASLSDSEAERLLGGKSFSSSRAPSATHFERNRYRYRY